MLNVGNLGHYVIIRNTTKLFIGISRENVILAIGNAKAMDDVT